MSSIDSTGNLTSITIEERIAAGVAPDPVEDPVEIKITETEIPQKAEDTGSAPLVEQTGQKTAEESVIFSTASTAGTATAGPTFVASDDAATSGPESSAEPDVSSPQERVSPSNPYQGIVPMAYPFRDPDWESAEKGYHTLAIQEINALARSYNLMAPKIAQKPYYTLSRELNRCYADIAPTLADEILNRSRKGPVRVQVAMHKEGGIMEKFQGTGHVAKVRDEPGERGYGFKEFWRDLFAKDEKKGNDRQVA